MQRKLSRSPLPPHAQICRVLNLVSRSMHRAVNFGPSLCVCSFLLVFLPWFWLGGLSAGEPRYQDTKMRTKTPVVSGQDTGRAGAGRWHLARNASDVVL